MLPGIDTNHISVQISMVDQCMHTNGQHGLSPIYRGVYCAITSASPCCAEQICCSCPRCVDFTKIRPTVWTCAERNGARSILWTGTSLAVGGPQQRQLALVQGSLHPLRQYPPRRTLAE